MISNSAFLKLSVKYLKVRGEAAAGESGVSPALLSLNVGQESLLPSLPSASSLLSCLIQSKLASGII